MDRKIPLWIPLWILLILVLLFSFVLVSYGWVLKTTIRGSDRLGFLGEAAIEIAEFPSTAKSVFQEIVGMVSGSDRERSLRTKREENIDYSEFVPVASAPGIDVEGLLMRVDRDKMARGWRFLVGAFAINGEIENSVLLMSPDLRIVQTWILDEIPVDGREPRPKFRKFIHGVAVLPDGSLVFTYDGAISLQRVDACGERQWSIGGKYHHAVTLDDTGQSVWTFDTKNSIVQVAVEDGSILRRITMDDIIAKNPLIDILEIRREHPSDLGGNSRNTEGIWMHDQFHLNDVDPLPAAIADRFEGFEAGDLVVSARSLNLVFVVDPNTHEIKWWRSGVVQRQHDPDWLPNGEIMILNNRMSRDFSEIVSINPRTFERKTLFDGRQNDFYTRIRGKHQLFQNGPLVITSSQQGRAFEVNRDGEIVFEVVNVKADSDTTNYVISEMNWFPPDHFDMGKWKCAPDG